MSVYFKMVIRTGPLQNYYVRYLVAKYERETEKAYQLSVVGKAEKVYTFWVPKSALFDRFEPKEGQTISFRVRKWFEMPSGFTGWIFQNFSQSIAPNEVLAS